MFPSHIIFTGHSGHKSLWVCACEGEGKLVTQLFYNISVLSLELTNWGLFFFPRIPHEIRSREQCEEMKKSFVSFFFFSIWQSETNPAETNKLRRTKQQNILVSAHSRTWVETQTWILQSEGSEQTMPFLLSLPLSHVKNYFPEIVSPPTSCPPTPAGRHTLLWLTQHLPLIISLSLLHLSPFFCLFKLWPACLFFLSPIFLINSTNQITFSLCFILLHDRSRAPRSRSCSVFPIKTSMRYFFFSLYKVSFQFLCNWDLV